MNYFITGSVDYWTSAIEISEVQRLHIFDKLKQPACIIETKYNEDHELAFKKFHIQDRVINIFQYFQQLPYLEHENNQEIVDRVINRDRYTQDIKLETSPFGLVINNQERIRINYHPKTKWLTYVENFDKYGRPTSTSFYDHGFLSYTNYYDDNGHQLVRVYYNQFEQPIITYYYHWNATSKKATVFQINLIDENGVNHVFDREEEFRAYFFDRLVENDPYPVLLSDRSDAALEAFELMRLQVPRFQYFHAAFIFSGKPTPVDDLDKVELYEKIPEMYKKGQISGIISSTKKEAAEAGAYYKTHSYALPVFATHEKTLNNPVPFAQRKKDQLIAVARIDNVKQLDHIANAVIKLKKKHPKIDLKIYGYDSDENDYEAPKRLKKIIKDNKAQDYIHLCKYKQNLSGVYNTAQIEILTSKTEGFAIAILEAQEHGCPVISYDINYGPSEIVDNGKSGMLIKPNDQKALTNSIDNLLSHQDILKEFSKNSPEAVRQYSFDNLAKRWKDFLIKENIYLKPRQ